MAGSREGIDGVALPDMGACMSVPALTTSYSPLLADIHILHDPKSSALSSGAEKNHCIPLLTITI